MSDDLKIIGVGGKQRTPPTDVAHEIQEAISGLAANHRRVDLFDQGIQRLLTLFLQDLQLIGMTSGVEENVGGFHPRPDQKLLRIHLDLAMVGELQASSAPRW